MSKKYLSLKGNFVLRIFVGLILLFSISTEAQNSVIATPSAVTIQIDAALNRRAINPLIYGTAYATTAQLLDLNCPLNREGGNNTTRYNWQLNADNRANDFYFESIPFANTAGEIGDTFIQNSKNGNAQPMLTIPIIDWIAKVGPNRTKLASFSISKYGAQTGNDALYFPDAGNGIRTNGQNVIGNDPNDANVPNSVAFEQGYVQHLINRWGNANNNGLRYYILDNEHSIWFSTHRDVAPTGATMDDIFAKMRDYAEMIKNNDPNAQVIGPEEWGWGGYRYSGFDQWYSPLNNWATPDRVAHGNMDYTPWLLQQFKNYETQNNGRRILDVFTLHIYPQGGESGNDVTPAIQQKRNRSTRSLWDVNYTDESWINDKVKLIPRMKDWVSQYYPNTKIGVTEYNWGAENHINGATAQADVLGIFGREGMDLATRWTTPETTTPSYKAMKMYRNYDGQNKGFGETSVAATVPNPDEVSAFAAVRASDGALTVMVINKVETSATTTLNLANFANNGTSQVWQLTAANQINRLADVSVTNNALNVTLPPQSISLFVVGAVQITSPTNLSGIKLGNSVKLDWQDNTPDEDGFTIERAVGDSAEFVPIFRTNANQTSYRAGIKYGSYSFRVKTMRGGAFSNPSNVVRLGRQ